MKQGYLIISLLLVWGSVSQAQNERKFIRQGNKYFEDALKVTDKLDTAQFNKAEIEYRKALEKKPDNAKWDFNLGDALYKQKKFDESIEKFKGIADRTIDKTEKSRALYNQGNSLLYSNKLDESIAAYKEALRNNPRDVESKYNLLYAMKMKKKKDDQKKKQDQKKDQNKDKNKDKDKDKDKDKNKDQKKDQDKNKDQQNKDQQKQQQQQQQSKISKQNAEQMLQALENDEKKTQEKVKKVQALKAQSKKVEKDW